MYDLEGEFKPGWEHWDFGPTARPWFDYMGRQIGWLIPKPEPVEIKKENLRFVRLTPPARSTSVPGMAHNFEGIEPFPIDIPLPSDLSVLKFKIRDEVSGYELIGDAQHDLHDNPDQNFRFNQMELDFMKDCYIKANPGFPVFNITFFWE